MDRAFAWLAAEDCVGGANSGIEVGLMADESIDFTNLDPSKLDEYAKTDPIALRVAEHLDKIPTIREFTYLFRLTDTLIFVNDLLDVHEAAKKQMVGRKMRGLPEIILPYVKPGLPKEAIDFIMKAMELQFEKKVTQYEPWLLNQGLVMLCTTLDVFLEHVLDVIFRGKVELLYHHEESRRLQLKNIVALGSAEAVVADVRRKEVRRFGHQDINKRLQYLESRCGIPVAKVFDWSASTAEAREQFSDWDLRKLNGIYEDRHAVVHSDKLPLTKRSELEQIKEFFDKIVLNASGAAKEAHDGLWSDPERFMATAELYQRFRAESS